MRWPCCNKKKKRNAQLNVAAQDEEEKSGPQRRRFTVDFISYKNNKIKEIADLELLLSSLQNELKEFNEQLVELYDDERQNEIVLKNAEIDGIVKKLKKLKALDTIKEESSQQAASLQYNTPKFIQLESKFKPLNQNNAVDSLKNSQDLKESVSINSDPVVNVEKIKEMNLKSMEPFHWNTDLQKEFHLQSKINSQMNKQSTKESPL